MLTHVYFLLFHLGAGGAGWIKIGSPSCCRWAVWCLIFWWRSVVVVVVVGPVGSPCSAGGGVPVVWTRRASPAGFPWHAPICDCSRDCGSVRCAACSSPARWASPGCSSRWWAPWWGGDGHWSFRRANFCSTFSLWCLLFYLLNFALLARLAVRAGFLFGFFLLKCRLIFCLLWIAFFVISLVEGDWWRCSFDVELFFGCGCAGLWRYMVVYMTVSHYSLGMVTRTWSTLYLQRQFLI